MNFTIFCQTYKDECKETAGTFSHDGPIVLNYQLRTQLIQVNSLINDQIAPDANKKGLPGIDPWLLSPISGNCADYAVTKRHYLLQLGWPSAALLLVRVETTTGGGHLVLLVRTRQVDLILDNLNPSVMPISAVNYNFVLIQSPEGSMYWRRALTK